MTVLRNCRVLPELTPGFDGDRADIVIEGAKIAEILPTKTVCGGQILDQGSAEVDVDDLHASADAKNRFPAA